MKLRDYTKTTITVATTVADRLRIHAALNRRSMSAQADIVLMEYCAKEDKKLIGNPINSASK